MIAFGASLPLILWQLSAAVQPTPTAEEVPAEQIPAEDVLTPAEAAERERIRALAAEQAARNQAEDAEARAARLAASSSRTAEDSSDNYSPPSSAYDALTGTSSEAFVFGRDVADAYYWEYHPSWVQGGDTPEQWCSSWAVQWYQIDYGYLQSDVRDEVRAGCVAQARTFDYWNR